VVTGGEPCIHETPLTCFWQNGSAASETSGPEVRWVYGSGAEGQYARRGACCPGARDELRETLSDIKPRIIALQPISRKKTRQPCTDICIARNWRLSMQTHI
jgi:7-carboxy-7-deazaguanine synthase